MHGWGMWLLLFWNCNGGVVTLTTCWTLLISSLCSTAKFSWTKFQERATLAGRYLRLPEDKRDGHLTSQDASATPPLARNCCCNHRDTTQTEISRQSQSFKELKLPTKLALGRAPTCESGPAAKPVQAVFSQHLFGMFVVSLLPPTFRWSSRRQGWAKKGS